MSNSIIDQQRDNADFVLHRSPYNGLCWVVNNFTGENHPDFFKANVKPVGFGPDLFKQALRDNPESDMYKKLNE